MAAATPAAGLANRVAFADRTTLTGFIDLVVRAPADWCLATTGLPPAGRAARLTDGLAAAFDGRVALAEADFGLAAGAAFFDGPDRAGRRALAM